MKSRRQTLAAAYRSWVRETVPEVVWEAVRDHVPSGEAFSVALACAVFYCCRGRRAEGREQRMHL